MIDEAKATERVRRISECRQEPAFLRDLRTAALAAALQMPAPPQSPLKKRIGDSGVDLFRTPTSLAVCLPGNPDTTPLEKGFRADCESRIQFVNGRKTAHCLTTELARHGILFTDLGLAARMFPKYVENDLGTALPYTADRYAALQTALWTEGLFLYIPKNVRAEQPLQVWWRRTESGGHLHPRVLIVAEEGSDVTLLLGETSHLTGTAVSLGLTEIIAKSNARVRIVSVQEQDAKMTRVHLLHAKAARGARVEVLTADLGAGYHNADLKAELNGDGAAATFDAVCLGSGQRHLDLTLTAHHKGSHTDSRMRAHALATGEANLQIQTVSQIDKGAVKAHSTQEERMILLDPTARAQAVPTLYIEEEDVQCDHALSVGPLPDDPMFYLMARGLSETEAKRLLLRGFLQPFVKALPFQGMVPALDGWLDRHIDGRAKELSPR